MRRFSEDSSETTNEEVSTFNGGVHKCIVVSVDNLQSHPEYIDIYVDIIGETDSSKGFFGRVAKNAVSNWWSSGRKRVYVYERGTEDKMSKTYKAMCTAFERSNPGYSLKETGYNEQTLVGKEVACVWREEEYLKGTERKKAYKIFGFRSTTDFDTHSIDIPEPLTLEEKESLKQPSPIQPKFGVSQETQTTLNVPFDDEFPDLPF